MADEKTSKLRATSPVFLVGDIAATIRWYQANLGFSARAVPASPPHAFGILENDDVVIMLQQLDGYRKPGLYGERDGGVWDVYVRTEGVRELFRKLSALPDVEILEPLCPQEHGAIEFVVRDPNGYVLVFGEPT